MNCRSSGVVCGTRALLMCMALALVQVAYGSPTNRSPADYYSNTNNNHHHHHHLMKRSFLGIECKGVYDKIIFAKLDRICEDCYNLFREPQVHTLCRKDCFTSTTFKGCIDTLQLNNEEEIKVWIQKIHGADPGY